jgi:hypothetical protein
VEHEPQNIHLPYRLCVLCTSLNNTAIHGQSACLGIGLLTRFRIQFDSLYFASGAPTARTGCDRHMSNAELTIYRNKLQIFTAYSKCLYSHRLQVTYTYTVSTAPLSVQASFGRFYSLRTVCGKWNIIGQDVSVCQCGPISDSTQRNSITICILYRGMFEHMLNVFNYESYTEWF